MSNPPARRIVLFGIAAVVSGLVAFLPIHARTAPPPDHTVRVIIDYGDGVQKHFLALPWKKNMTVLDALTAAKSSSHGITFQHTGSGPTTFLVKIDDLENEGGGGNRNWIFWVNTSLGDKSCGVYKLDPSDVVLWKFSSQQMKK